MPHQLLILQGSRWGNGRHLCLVFDVLGPNTSSWQNAASQIIGWAAAWDATISAQVLLAVDYLHLSGLVHGGVSSLAKVIAVSDQREKDIHTGNILFRLDSLSLRTSDNRRSAK